MLGVTVGVAVIEGVTVGVGVGEGNDEIATSLINPLHAGLIDLRDITCTLLGML